MESNIIVEGFKSSEKMHGLRYMWMIGDGDSSVFSSVCIRVPYSRFVQKVECTNHAIKCFRGNLEKLAKEHSNFAGRNGLTAGKIRHLTKGMKCVIQQHSTTGDSVALRKDLRNCPRHCFGDHRQCNASFCKKAGEGSGGKTILHILNILTTFLAESLEVLPPGLLRAVDTIADRLVTKATQLVHNKTTNLCENYMSVRCKMDGGKFFNRIQSGSFQHRCMAAALRVQYGPGWVAHVWQSLFQSTSDIMDIYATQRKRKHFLDSARKVTQKYKNNAY